LENIPAYQEHSEYFSDDTHDALCMKMFSKIDA